MKHKPILAGRQNGHERRFRSAPKAWQDVIKAIYGDDYQGEPITYVQIEEVALKHNLNITRESLRVKMARYKKSGYIKSASKRGTFWVTYEGQHFFNLEKRQKPEPKTAALVAPPSKWALKPKTQPSHSNG